LENRIAAILAAVARRGVATFFVQIRDDYFGTFTSESDCGRAAHPARRARDDCDFSIESAHCHCSRIKKFRRR
jgi:hypothetical protein